MQSSLAVMRRNNAPRDRHRFGRFAPLEKQEHIAAGNVEGTKPVVLCHNLKAEQALIELHRPAQVVQVKGRLEVSGDVHFQSLESKRDTIKSYVGSKIRTRLGSASSPNGGGIPRKTSLEKNLHIRYHPPLISPLSG